jgi:hypothetical protein
LPCRKACNHKPVSGLIHNCKNTAPGTEVALTEAAHKNPDDALDAGQGLTGLFSSIMNMTGQPGSLLNPAALTFDPATCKPVYPHRPCPLQAMLHPSN